VRGRIQNPGRQKAEPVRRIQKPNLQEAGREPRTGNQAGHGRRQRRRHQEAEEVQRAQARGEAGVCRNQNHKGRQGKRAGTGQTQRQARVRQRTMRAGKIQGRWQAR